LAGTPDVCLNEKGDRAASERGRRLGRAADLLVEIRACEIDGMR
jgi:hypothetical protein